MTADDKKRRAAELRRRLGVFWKAIDDEIVLHLIIGIAVVAFVYRDDENVLNKVWEKVGLMLVTSLCSALIGQILFKGPRKIGAIEQAVAGIGDRLTVLEKMVDGDERMIFGRSESDERRQVAVLAVDPVPHGAVPEVVDTPKFGDDKGRWGYSVSVLKFDRFQDLLFSLDYLAHFFALREHSVNCSRIIIINDRPRSRDAVRAFLTLSSQLSIDTYVYRKSEFYSMIDSLGKKNSRIIEHQPELNLAVADPGHFRGETGKAVSRETEFLLRYQGATKIEQCGPAGPVPVSQVRALLFILHSALHQDRKGIKGFERLLNNPCTARNPWAKDELTAAAERAGVSL